MPNQQDDTLMIIHTKGITIMNNIYTKQEPRLSIISKAPDH